MSALRDSVVDEIEIALVELRGVAQPRDLAQLQELLLDAKEAEDAEQLQRIDLQARALRAFCEGRSASSTTIPKQR
jgi:hypothetical protein